MMAVLDTMEKCRPASKILSYNIREATHSQTANNRWPNRVGYVWRIWLAKHWMTFPTLFMFSVLFAQCHIHDDFAASATELMR